MQYRFYNENLKSILGHGYPYYITPSGDVIGIDAYINKKEPDYKESKQKGIGYHLATGLYDKTGKQIYEADIIETPTQKGYIVFIQGCFVVRDIITERSTPLLKLKKDDISITGNIIENPLQKAKKATTVPDFSKVKIKKEK